MSRLQSACDHGNARAVARLVETRKDIDFMTRTSTALIIIASLLMAGLAGRARADVIGLHSGMTDPLTEGFSTVSFGASSTAGPISNDLGKPAWSIAGTAQSSQFGYMSGALTATQQAEVAATGFTLTMVARVVQGLAPAYDSTSHVVIGGADLDTGVKRFEVDLSLDSQGNTVAVLPTSIDNGGPGFSIRAPGANYTVTGNDWHTYQLVYNPTTQLADLFIDGVDQISGYAGHTSFVENRGLVWSANSGGQGDFNFVNAETGTLSTTPEPSSLLICGGTLLLGLGLNTLRRRVS
jgi:hypothetical protein